MPDGDDLSGYTQDEINPEAKPDFFSARTRAQVDIAQGVRANIGIARNAGLTPDREAKIVRKSAQTGLAPAAIRELPPHYLDESQPNPVQLAQEAPATAAFLAASPTNTAIAGQDWKSLQDIEGWRAAYAAEQKRADDELNAQAPPNTLADAYGQGKRTVQLSEAYFQNYMLGNPEFMEWAAGQESAQQQYAERDRNTNGLRYILNAATEQLPLMGEALESGAKGGLTAGTTAAGVVALAGQLGPQIASPEEVVTVPTAAVGGFMVGGSAAMAARMFRIEAGLAAHDMAQIRDLNGQPLDPDIIRAAAVGVGALNSGLEMFGWSKLVNTLPTGWIKSAFGKKALSAALIDPNVSKALKAIAGKYGTAVAAETATEMSQEVSAILGGWIATHAGELLDDQAFGQAEKQVFTPENLGRVMESGQKAFAASLVFGAPGTSLTAYRELKQAKDAKTFADFLKSVNEGVNASPVQGRSPEKMREFLQVGGYGGEAFIDSDTAQGLSPELLAKVGVNQDAVAESDITGQSIPVRLEDLHTKLTPEEFKQVLPGIKAGQALPSEAQAKEFSSAEAVARAAETYDAATLEETQFKQGLKNLQRDIVTAIGELPKLREEIRAQGITASEYASNTIALWESMSRRLALEGRELNETLRKVTIGAVSQAPQMRGKGRVLRQDLSEEAKAYVASLTPEEQTALAPSIKYLEENPDPNGDLGNLQMVAALMKGKTLEQRDGSVVLDAPRELNHAALVKQWRKAHGDRTPVTGDKDWQALVDKSDATDLETKGRVFRQDSALPDLIDVNGKQRPTRNADGAPLAATEEGIRNFWAWFGDSKVVDVSGRPIVVYHGTSKKFSRVNLKKGTQGLFWFSSDRGLIERGESGAIGTSVIMELYAKIESPADWKQYDKLGLYEYEPKGIDGAVLKNQDGSFDGFVIAEPTQIKSATNNRGTFDPQDANILRQDDTGRANANTQILEDAYIINMFKGANLSSALHESAHVFLAELGEVVSSGVASDAMIRDWNSITKWLGVDLLDPKLTDDQYRSAHEQFARGFEEYLREGKAPSPELADAFERFKQWLTRIYQTVANLGPDRVPLTDEVRSAFGRLLATKQETRQTLADSELVIRTEADLNKLGLGPDEKARINQLLEQGRARTEQNLQRARDRGNRAREKEWRAEAVRDVLTQPVYQAMATIKAGGGLRQAAIRYDFGGDTVRALRERGLVAVKNDDGMQARDVANTHGFDSEEALIVALLDAQPSRDAAVQFHVEQQRQQYDATHGVEETLIDAKEFADYMEEMGRYIGRSVQGSSVVSQKTFQEIAENRVKSMPMAQAIKSDAALAAMQMALKAERRAVAAGDFKTALKANDRARLNFEMAKVSKKMRKLYERTVAQGNKNAKAEQGVMDEQHHKNLVAALQRYGLLRGEPKIDLDKRTPLADLLASVDTDTADPTALFPPAMVNEVAQQWTGLSAAEFEQLSNLLNFLNGRGRAMVKDAVTYSELTRAQIMDAVTEPMTKLGAKAVVSPDSWFGKLIGGARRYYASLDQFQFVMRRADGATNVGPKGVAGPNERLIYQPLAAAWSEKKRLSDQVRALVSPHIAQIRQSMLSAPKYLTNTGVAFPEVLRKKTKTWTFEQVVAIALNMGNGYNRQAILDGYGLTESDLSALTSILKPEDWNAIQGIWSAIDTLWPQIDAVHYRLNHFHQEKVTADAFITPTGQRLAGGYYPVKFDSDLSAQVGEWTEKDNFMNSTNALFPSPTVQKGFTKARSSTGGKPINLSVRVLGEHLDFATQYITHAEVVKDMDRIMSAPVKGETNPYYSLMAEKLGDDVAKLIRPTLKYIARPEGEILGFIDKMLNASKGMATAYILGLNIKTALTNLTGITTILTDAGAPTVFRGYQHVISNPRAAYEEMIKLSAYMANRSQIYDRDIRRQLDDLALDNRLISRSTREGIKASAWIFLWAGDMAMVMPAWWGTYQKALASNGGDTRAAVTVADELVAATNPSARPIDLSQMQRSQNGFARMFTMFSSFTIKYGNRQRLYYTAWKNGNLSGLDYMRHVVLEAIIPSMLTTVGYAMLWGHEPGDEDDLKHSIADLTIYQFQGLPFFRDIIGAAVSFAADDFVRDPTKSPIFTGVDLAKKMGGSVYRFAEDMDDEKKAEKAVWAFADMVSFRIGVPAPKMVRNLMEGMRQYDEEDGTLFNVLVVDPDKREK
jgi:hypothetical protein